MDEILKHIPINRPSVSDLEIGYVNDAMRNGWGSKCYDYIYRFEKEFAEYQESKFALAASSCTGAIHIALLALGVKAGDEVIVPDITWIASVAPILYIGAKPVFVDVLPDSWCLDPLKTRAAITNKTKCIIPVHVYGNLVEMDEIMSIAGEYKLVVLEDAAEGLGSCYKGKKAGSIGDAGVFSFHGTKTVSTGEGGMLVTNRPEVYDKAKILNDHGVDPEIGKTYWMEQYGYKYKMSNLQAAMGCAQIERAEELVAKKREIFGWYKNLLAGFPCILNPEPSYTRNSYWMPTVVIDKSMPFNRDDLLIYMKQNRIDCRPFFYPLTSLPMFKSKPGNIVAYDIYQRALNLPSYHDLEENDVKKVTLCLRSFITKDY